MAVGLLVPLIGLAACGDDDVTGYCDFGAELDEREELPSDDDLDRIVDLAPSEIHDEVELIAKKVKELG